MKDGDVQSTANAACDCAENPKALAECHLPLVASLVRRFPPGLCEPEELFQQGCIGLMKAAVRFRPEMQLQFSTYAVPVILGEMRALSRQLAPIHIPRPERELRQRYRKIYASLSEEFQREPTVDEIAAALCIPAAELAFLTENITFSSADEMNADGICLADTASDPQNWLTQIELEDMISRLHPADRQLLTLRHFEGLTQVETAARMGLTQVQVSRRETVLRRHLRQLWYTVS